MQVFLLPGLLYASHCLQSCPAGLQKRDRNENMKGIMGVTDGMGILRKWGGDIPIQQEHQIPDSTLVPVVGLWRCIYTVGVPCRLDRLLLWLNSPFCSNSLRPSNTAIHFRRLIARNLETGGETANDKGSTNTSQHSQYRNLALAIAPQ